MFGQTGGEELPSSDLTILCPLPGDAYVPLAIFARRTGFHKPKESTKSQRVRLPHPRLESRWLAGFRSDSLKGDGERLPMGWFAEVASTTAR